MLSVFYISASITATITTNNYSEDLKTYSNKNDNFWISIIIV